MVVSASEYLLHDQRAALDREMADGKNIMPKGSSKIIEFLRVLNVYCKSSRPAFTFQTDGEI
jgi:hypothetical protein